MWPEGQLWKPRPADPATVAAPNASPNVFLAVDRTPTQSQTPTYCFARLAPKVGVLRFAEGGQQGVEGGGEAGHWHCDVGVLFGVEGRLQVAGGLGQLDGSE